VPLYEYQCKKCRHIFEKIQQFSDSPVKKCPKCGGPVERLISAPAVQFKGSGWYVTDYARSGASDKDKSKASDSAPASSSEKDGAKSGEKSDSTKKAAKTESKTKSQD
jgi:putative FmdB family regulatory protein